MKKKLLLILESNIDDMNPQFYTPLMDQLFEKGALDVTLTPLLMKKGRPGVLLQVLSEKKYQKTLIDLIVTETPTGGVRVMPVTRYELGRTFKTVKTPYGPIRVKVFKKGKKLIKEVPEFEDVRRQARKMKVPLHVISAAAIKLSH